MSELPVELTRQYDVALSFAGEDRQYVRSVADGLQKAGVSVFYDDYEKANLWGKDLYAHLTSVYRDRSRYTIMFISQHYAQKLWTNHERKSAQAKAFSESREYILPVLFDDTEISGMLNTVGYIDARSTTPEELVELIRLKLSERIQTASSEEIAEVRPAGARVVRMRETLWPLFERIEQIQSGEVPGVSSGIATLDRLTGGWRGGSLVIVHGVNVIAREFAFHCAFHASALANIPTLLSSSRESPFALTERVLSWGSGVGVQFTRKPGMPDSAYPRLATAGGVLNTVPLSFAENFFVGSEWSDTLRETLVNLSDADCRLLVLDLWSEPFSETQVEVTLTRLRALAEEFALPIVVSLRATRGTASTATNISSEISRVSDALISVTAGESWNVRRNVRKVELRLMQGRYEDEIAAPLGADECGFFFELSLDPDAWPMGPFDPGIRN
jgi:TIR domain/DnaB-like helicase C terminal domain